MRGIDSEHLCLWLSSACIHNVPWPTQPSHIPTAGLLGAAVLWSQTELFYPGKFSASHPIMLVHFNAWPQALLLQSRLDKICVELETGSTCRNTGVPLTFLYRCE